MIEYSLTACRAHGMQRMNRMQQKNKRGVFLGASRILRCMVEHCVSHGGADD
jgi:hypothetical protein